ncbi:MAG: hypothetical protein KatS3mg039_1695 [Candidatus Kapaibacterium sp.]|nr:MAG: hypothetical protein KatS3mg039_1695 [Candidatus Kapabacteria bacterium]
MKRLILASLAGGVVLFVWGMLAWTVLPHHTMTMRPLPKEDSVVATLQHCIPSEGMYYFPGMMEGMDAHMQGTNTEEAWRQRHMRGPIGMILYIPTGRDPMMAGQFVWGLVIFIVAAFIASWLLSRSTAVAGSYWQRVSFCGILGIFLAVADHLVAMNWLYFPADYTAAMIADAVVGWTLAGLAIAAVVKAP